MAGVLGADLEGIQIFLGSLDGLPKILESGSGKVRCTFKNISLEIDIGDSCTL